MTDVYIFTPRTAIPVLEERREKVEAKINAHNRKPARKRRVVDALDLARRQYDLNVDIITHRVGDFVPLLRRDILAGGAT